ncbi:hypothetical protein NDU88_010053 [Pleurodeles waltl]|uniref:Uncharacterized protein n=1 Tax=Pleurodeles waltl TaxID=8319 RepID=A0AAV7QZ59_PLEWA|nr:hypothetical protein NDU88_010053 [Pleurodeles waltl]
MLDRAASWKLGMVCVPGEGEQEGLEVCCMRAAHKRLRGRKVVARREVVQAALEYVIAQETVELAGQPSQHVSSALKMERLSLEGLWRQINTWNARRLMKW